MHLAAALCTAAGLTLVGCTIDAAGTGPAATGGGGTGGGTTTTSTGTGGQGGTGGGPVEDCLDGVDNDGDGLADCADPDCNPEVECVPAAPADWAGPLRVGRVVYPAADPAPTCPDGSAPETLYAAPEEAACDVCDCAPGGASCTVPSFRVYFNTNICLVVGTNTQTVTPANTGCVNYNGSNATTSARFVTASTVVNANACTAAGGALSSPAMWGDELHLCSAGATGGGCDQGSVCAPRAAAALDQVCVSKAGSDPCPAGWDDQDVQAYQDGTDGRSCTPCGCGASCSEGSLTLHDVSGCTGTSVLLTSTCVETSDILDGNFGVTVERGALSVTCTQSTPMGSVQTSGETKVCCAPPPPPPN